MYFSFVISLVQLTFLLRGVGTFPLSFLTGGWGPDYDRQGRSGAMDKVICKTATADCFGSGEAAAMALRAACSGIEMQDYTHFWSRGILYPKLALLVKLLNLPPGIVLLSSRQGDDVHTVRRGRPLYHTARG